MDIITETRAYHSEHFKILHDLWDDGDDKQAEKVMIYWRGKPALALPENEAAELLNLLWDCLEAGKK